MTALLDLDDAALPGLPALRRYGAGVVLAHKQGRRATVLVPGPDGGRIAELVAHDHFTTALAVTRASSRHGRVAPRLLDVDADHCLLWSELVAGTSLDRVAPDRRDRAVARLGPVLAAVHAAPTAGLPPWDAWHPARKLRRWYDATLAVAPDLVAPVGAAVARLDGPVPPGRAAPVSLHGDHSLRNVLHDDVTGELRLVDWDRTAVGPAEVDLAPVVGLLGGEGLLRGYRGAGGTVDDRLLTRLVLLNRVTRALRRVHRGADEPRVASARLAALVEEVADARF